MADHQILSLNNVSTLSTRTELTALQGETGIIVTDRAAVKDRGLLGAIDIRGNLTRR